MGFLGGDNEPTQADQLADQQYQSNQQELEQKKANLYQTRLDIIRGQGAQSWVANRTTPNPNQGVKEKISNFGFGGNGFLNS